MFWQKHSLRLASMALAATLACAGVAVPLACADDGSSASDGAYAADHVLVTYDDGTVESAPVSMGDTIDETVDEAEDLPGVASSQPDYAYQLIDDVDDAATLSTLSIDSRDGDPVAQTAFAALSLTNDPYAAITDTSSKTNQYYLYGTVSPTVKGANVLDAWDAVTCDGSVAIAVFDTGCQVSHEDLAGTVDADLAYNATDGSSDVTDTNGHGTHVAGIAGAAANNGLGIAGSSYNATIIPVKIMDASGSIYTSYVIKAIEYIESLIDKGLVKNLRVVNMSIGGYDESSQDDAALNAALEKLRDEYGVLPVCAGGNGDGISKPYTKKSSPGDFDSCVSVTALKADGLNCAWSDYNEYKDISAPGERLCSTYKGTTDSEYTRKSGTSMASPLVAGIAALCFAAVPDATCDQVVQAIEDSADQVIDPARDPDETGSAGAINAAHAVALLKGTMRSLKQAAIDPIDPQEATGTEAGVEPALTVTYDGKVLQEGTDYTVTYADNVVMGTATATITGFGSYCGYAQVQFTVVHAAGWFRENGVTCFYRGGEHVTGWQQIEGAWYCFDAEGAMQTGTMQLNGYEYDLGTDGVLATGDSTHAWSSWRTITEPTCLTTGTQIRGCADSQVVKTRIVNALGHDYGDWVTVTEATLTAKGSRTRACNRCGVEQTQETTLSVGWHKESGKWYYILSGSTVATGWQKLGGSWYYFTSDGVMLSGWQKLSGSWYYLNSSGKMLTGWQKIGKATYYLGTNGKMVTGWKKVNGKWYHFASSGKMETGWKKISGTWYYFGDYGKMVTGKVLIGSYWYTFSSSGAWNGSKVKA